MAHPSDPGSESAAADGWAALAEARWEAARDRFEEALARGETPEALEGLSWATWWLDDADAVLAARESAYRLYRDGGDPAAAARMAIWLAVDQLDFHGARAVAQGWFARARRLLEGLPPGPELGWLDFHEGYVAHARGEGEEARSRARSAAELGRRFRVPDLEMLGLALEGASLVASAHVQEGMRCLDEATATALEGDAEIPISGAWSCCFLVSACSSVLDWERAAEWCERIREFAERYGSRYMLAFCRAEYGSVLLWRGRWREAEEHFSAAVEDYASSRPAWAAGPLVGLAELRRREGRRREAVTLLDDAGSSGAELVCRAALALDEGDDLSAVELAERALRKEPDSGPLDQAPALSVLVRAAAAAGEPGAAARALAQLDEIAKAAGTALLRAQADAASGALAAARGEHDEARRLYEDALDLFHRGGAPYEALGVRLELASTLVALGRLGAAEAEAAAALDGAKRLGATGLAERAQSVLASAAGGPDKPAEVTPREEDVLRLLAEGLTNKQIAERLVVSEHTVHRHVTNILRKLGLPSRSAAAAYAVRTGLAGQSR